MLSCSVVWTRQRKTISPSPTTACVVDLRPWRSMAPGETVFEMRWRTDFEKAVVAAIDYVEKRSEIDPSRIGIIGRSMGGCYAPKTAAIDERIKALVAWGVMYHLQNLANVPKHTLEGFMFVTTARPSRTPRSSMTQLICR